MGRDLLVEFCTHGPGHQTHEDAVPRPAPISSPNGLCGAKTGYTCKEVALESPAPNMGSVVTGIPT